MRYFVKTPWWLKKIYAGYVWSITTREKNIYLTFDDGPHPQATPFVLDTLKTYNAKASFFCIGKNVLAHPDLYRRIIDEGHTVGNHTQHHLNGWKTDDAAYIADVVEAKKLIDSRFFRPPYGRISRFQAGQVKTLMGKESQIIMWDVISGDFDPGIDDERCLHNVILNATRGSVVVFHDSEKAMSKLKFVLPLVMENLAEKGYRFCALKDVDFISKKGIDVAPTEEGEKKPELL